MNRLLRLATGRYVLTDMVTGEDQVEWWDWRQRWAIDGIHSWKWWWVQHWGKRDCGCTINPVTRRRVLTRGDCPTHGFPGLFNRDRVPESEENGDA